MDVQHVMQARNCIANYCFYPRPQANQLVDKMTDAELQAVLDIGNKIEMPDEAKKAEIDKILLGFVARLEGEAQSSAQEIMQAQKVLHAASGRFGTPPNSDGEPTVPGTDGIASEDNQLEESDNQNPPDGSKNEADNNQVSGSAIGDEIVPPGLNVPEDPAADPESREDKQPESPAPPQA